MNDGAISAGNTQEQLFGLESIASLSAAAHDLKAPLASMHYLCSMLRDSEITLSEADRQEYLWRIELSAQRGLQLIEGLTYAYNAAQLELDLEPVNVVHACEDILHELNPLASRLAQTVELRMPRSAAIALAHHSVLRSVVTNLCDNAFKHNPPESHVIVKVTNNSNSVQVAVRDNGPQLSLKNFRTLKERLGKEVNPLGGRVGSSGLGLYVSSQLAQAMHGDLSMVRHQNTGLTLQLQLQTSNQLSFL